jgi:hypothetical protein
VAVSVTELIRIGAVVIDRQLDLEITPGRGQIDEREVVERETVLHLEIEGLFVEFDRAPFVEHADHRVDRSCHRCGSSPGDRPE